MGQSDAERLRNLCTHSMDIDSDGPELRGAVFVEGLDHEKVPGLFKEALEEMDADRDLVERMFEVWTTSATQPPEEQMP